MQNRGLQEKIWKYINKKIGDFRVSEHTALHLAGLYGSCKSLFLSAFCQWFHFPLLAIFPEQEEAERVEEELESLLQEGVRFFPGSEVQEKELALINPRRAGMQMEVLQGLLSNDLKVVVATAEGAFLKVPPPSFVKASQIRLVTGMEMDFQNLIQRFLEYGYTRESVVERPGEISIRGGIIDIFPFTGEEPHRIEFFGDRIESIRIFDISTQRSISKVEALVVAPSIASAPGSSSLFDYFSDSSILYVEDFDLISAQLKKAQEEYGRTDLLEPECIENILRSRPAIFHSTLASHSKAIDLGVRPVQKFGLGATEIRRQLFSLCDEAEAVVLVSPTEDQQLRLKEYLALEERVPQNLHFDIAPIHLGFAIPEIRLWVYTEHDLFGRAYRRRRKPRFREGIPIRELSALSPGDFVVHVDHGIGEYLGLEQIKVGNVERECLAILYQDGDKLYVPVEKMERVHKYRAKEGVIPTLSKLGSGHWERLKTKTKESIKAIAKELLALYSAREALEGWAFSPDTVWQKELELNFQYEETPDQLKAIEEVKQDMERPRPMDRLVCGDVGYGKTEVAIRAAFKCVMDGLQVAVLVPTTVLAQQHFRTFSERLAPFPVVVEMLSRFRSRKEQKEILQKTERGEVDILIGTHRLLSKDVKFKKLGLLIIDEEQRFGVRHKETLKMYRKTVDVLTLSATPIPRTLYFSLMGIRDMSFINTPPKDRRPIITEVLPFSERVVEEAIRRELNRGGQVFYVYNRIHSIDGIARMIERLIPGIRVAVAHGKMEEEELERVMLDFDAKKYDCLVTTTIIESGLDYPNVNTLIVHRADQMGLAQLYQLRGRVGRSDQQGYAYLFTPPFELLTHEAIQRLRTIEEFTELGSGFQIALRDLEIRGAGNLLGVEQSGKMEAVGYELYLKLIEQAIQELKGEMQPKAIEELPREMECEIQFHIDAYLPRTYVSDETLRVNLYRRLAELREETELESFSQELLDRFGAIPPEASNLLEAMRIRILGAKRGLKKIVLDKDNILVIFNELFMTSFTTPESFSKKLNSMVEKSPYPVRFLQKKDFGIQIRFTHGDPLHVAKKILQTLS